MEDVKLFISAASNDFRATRAALDERIRAADVTVAIQEGFQPNIRTTLEKLDDYIQSADAVVHLVGGDPGAVAAGAEVSALLKRHPDLPSRYPALAEGCNPDAPVFTYTQWEAYLALFHDKPLVLCAPGQVSEQSDANGHRPVTLREPIGQPEHVARLNALQRFVDLPFLDASDLAARLFWALKKELARAGFRNLRAIDITHLPTTYARRLFGRARESQLLQGAWAGDKTRLLAFDAMGGAGKTALIRHFIDSLQAEGWGGAEAVFAWSFYSQGSSEDRQTSAQDFFNAAFAFFGETPPTEPGRKGQRLAALANRRRTLLVLDGLEPLQYYAPGSGASGAVIGGIKDPDLKTLLDGRISADTGLTLVTTRIPLSEFEGRAAFKREALDKLPLMAGIALLRSLGVEPGHPPAGFSMPPHSAFDVELAKRLPEGYDAAPDQEDAPGLPPLPSAIAADLAGAVTSLDGHALALTLAGNFIASARQGDVRAIHELPDLETLTGAPERNAFRVMRAIELGYAREIADTALPDGRPGTADPVRTPAGRQLALLACLGLFDQPVPRKLLEVVFGGDTPLQPAPEDVAMADDPAIELRVLDLQEEMKTLRAGMSGAGEIEKKRLEIALRPLKTEHDALIAVQRRVLYRRLFAGMGPRVEREPGQITAALQALAAQGLVSDPAARGGDPATSAVDCHPLVREFFARRIGWPGSETSDEAPGLDPELYRAAHSALYDFYRFDRLPAAFSDPVAYGVLALRCAFERDHYPRLRKGFLDGSLSEGLRDQTPPSIAKLRPDQLQKAFELVDGPQFETAKARFLPIKEDGMKPLFAAIAHGCAAGRVTEAWSEVYWPRVARGNEGFATKKLGLYGPELAALARFFEAPFIAPSGGLSPANRALVLNLAGFRLRALGRLTDAVAPFGAAVAAHVDQGNDKRAAGEAGNLSELLLVLGRIGGAAGDLAGLDWAGPEAERAGALAAAAAAVGLADRSGGAFERMGNRTRLAGALTRAGAAGAAEALFRAAEALQAEHQPQLPRLYSLAGYPYGELLLARGRVGEAGERAAWALQQYEQAGEDWLLAKGLDQLTLARTALAAPGAATDPGLLARFDTALTALRGANHDNFIAPALLARAEACLALGKFGEAAAMLDKADESAKRGPMPLFLTDALILRARLACAVGRPQAAAGPLDEAAALVETHQYGMARPHLALADLHFRQSLGLDTGAAAGAAIAAVAGDHAVIDLSAPLPGGLPDGLSEADGGGPGWWGLLPDLEALIGDDPAHADALTDLRTRRDAYNAARDAHLAEQEAKLSKQWEEEDRHLADPAFRKELSDALVASGYKPLDDTPLAEQRNDARNYLQQKRKALGGDADGPAIDPSQIPDELVEQLFNDPDTRAKIAELIQGSPLDKPLDQMSMDEKRAVVAGLMAAAQKAKAQSEGAGQTPDISDKVVRHIFADPEAQPMLKQVMAKNDLPGAPADLPFETQRQIVEALVAQGVIRFGDGSPEKG